MQERQRERDHEEASLSSVNYDTSRLQRRNSLSPTSPERLHRETTGRGSGGGAHLRAAGDGRRLTGNHPSRRSHPNDRPAGASICHFFKP